MNMLILIGMVIIFISAFFIIFSGNTLITSAFECNQENDVAVCRFSGLTPIATLSIVMIAFFLMIDALTIKILVSNLS